MGCDIHAYVEYADWEDEKGPYWKNFTANGGDRNYLMFGVLAGVRVADAKLFEPKGMPEGRCGWETQAAYWLHVAPENKPELANSEGWTSPANAERWVQAGYSVADHQDGKIVRVSGPDWHSHSWLTREELEQAIGHYMLLLPKHHPASKPPAAWLATVAAMRAFEDAGAKARLVFWFDN